MAVNFTDGGDYVVFYMDGKTMIGMFHTSDNIPNSITVSGGTHDSLGYYGRGQDGVDNESCYYVVNPCVIDQKLTIPTSGSAKLTWELTPMFFKDLINATDTNYASVAVAIPKSKAIITNIGGDIIDQELLSAYKELTE